MLAYGVCDQADDGIVEEHQHQRSHDAVAARGGACVVTADHGNSDHMLEPDGSPNTAHSTNLVPFVATVQGAVVREGGRLCDLAPTILALLGVQQPAEMTGRDLLEPVS